MPNSYTPFRSDFPSFALVDALQVIKDGAANTPAGRKQLAHTAFDLTGWALHATLEKDVTPANNVAAANHMATAPIGELSDDDAMTLLEQITLDGDSDGAKMAFACPISPAAALKLAAWLLKAASIVLPVIL